MSSPRSLLWIPEIARSLAAAGAMQGRGWTLGQVCEHLALTFEATLPDRESAGASRRAGFLQRVRQVVMKRAVFLRGRLPSGVPAPQQVAPSNSQRLDVGLDRLDAAVKDFERACDRGGTRWPGHPVFGSMSGEDWRRFHSIHAAHHFSFFRIASTSRQPAMKGGIA